MHLCTHVAKRFSTSAEIAPPLLTNKPSVLFGNARAADRIAFEAALFDEFTGKIAFGTLERTAAGGIFERLFFPGGVP